MAGVKAFCVVLYLCPRSCRGLAAAGKQEGTPSCYQETNTARCASSSRFLTKCPYYSFKMPLLFSYYSQNMSCHVHVLNIISHENTLMIELLYCIIRNDYCTAILVIPPFSPGGCYAGTIPSISADSAQLPSLIVP